MLEALISKGTGQEPAPAWTRTRTRPRPVTVLGRSMPAAAGEFAVSGN
jgi:hypothetical protein